MDLVLSKIEHLASKYDSSCDKKHFILENSPEAQPELQSLQESCLEATSFNSAHFSDLLTQVLALCDCSGDSQVVDKLKLTFKSTNEEEEANFNYFLLQTLLQVGINRSVLMKDTKDTIQNIDFLNLLHRISTIHSLPIVLGLNLLTLIFKIEPFLINNETMVDFFPRILLLLPDCKDPLLAKKKDELMIILIQIFSTNQHLLKFHQLFCSSVSLNQSSDIVLSQEFSTSYCKAIFEIHISQALSIWKLLLENFHLFVNQSYCKLFHMFVLHIKITDSKIVELHQIALFDLISNSLSKIKDLGTYEKFLEIYYSLACFKLMLSTFTHHQISDCPLGDVEYSTLHDLSHILPETLPKQWNNLNNKFSELDNDSQHYFLKIMIINFKFFKLQYALPTDVCSQLLKDLVRKITSNRHMIRYDLLHCIAFQIDNDDMVLLVEKMIDTLVEDFTVGNDVCDDIIKFISCNKQWENLTFQTIFITVYLNKLAHCTKSFKRKSNENEEQNLDYLGTVLSKLCSSSRRWIAFGSNTPDVKNRKHDKLLGLLTSSSALLLTGCVNQEAKYNVKLILNLLKILYKSAPIEYFSPINQLRCLLALWAILLISHHAKSTYRISLMEMFVALTLRLWDSVRRVWLFDLVPSHQYIYSVLSSLDQFQLDSNCYTLFDKLIENLYILSDCERSYEHITQLIDTLTVNPNVIELENILMLQTIVLRRNAEFIKKCQNSAKFTIHKDKFEGINQDISSLIYSNIKTYLDKVDNLAHLDSLFIIEGLTKLFEYKIFYNLSLSDELNLKSKWKKLLTKFLKLAILNLETKSVKSSLVQFLKVVIESRQKLSNSLPDNFIIDLWSKMLNQETTYEAVNWLQVYSNASTHQELPHSLDLRNASANIESQIAFFHSIKTLLPSIVETATESEFDCLLEQTLSGLSQWDVAQLVYVVQILLCITENKLDLNKANVLEKHFVPIFTLLTQAVFAFNKRADCKFDEASILTKCAALRICNHVVGHLSLHDLLNNSHIYIVYNLMLESNPLCHTSKPMIFGDQCLIMIEILATILTKRPYLVLLSMCSQLNVLTMLLSSVMRASDETNLVNVCTKDRLALENCSKSLAQLLTQLSRMDDFKPYVGHLIAYYLNQSLNVSPIEIVRKHLTSALFGLINALKGSQPIERLHSMLSPNSRELFKVMLEHYDKYHRFKGYV